MAENDVDSSISAREPTTGGKVLFGCDVVWTLDFKRCRFATGEGDIGTSARIAQHRSGRWAGGTRGASRASGSTSGPRWSGRTLGAALSALPVLPGR